MEPTTLSKVDNYVKDMEACFGLKGLAKTHHELAEFEARHSSPMIDRFNASLKHKAEIDIFEMGDE